MLLILNGFKINQNQLFLKSVSETETVEILWNVILKERIKEKDSSLIWNHILQYLNNLSLYYRQDFFSLGSVNRSRKRLFFNRF